MKGNITRRGTNSWRLKFDLGRDPVTNKRDTRYVSFKGTKAAAEKELRRLIGAFENGMDVSPDKMTVAEFIERWDRDWAASNVSPKTRERYMELLNHHVRPHLGAYPIQKLKPFQLTQLYSRLLRTEESTGLAPRTVGHVHRALRRALGHAVTWQIIAQNPADSVSPPKVEAGEMEILSEDQLHETLALLKGKAIYPIVAFALSTGMRRGEIVAVRWKDVDLAEAGSGKVQVRQSVEQTKNGLRLKPPKTKHGLRAISLPASVVAELRSVRLGQQEQRLALGLGKLPNDALVFPNPDGDLRSPNALSKDWTRNRDVLGLPKVTFHAFRHTHASQLIASGMDVLTISRRMGHASASITLNVYGHLFSTSDDRAAQIMEASFSSIGTE
jgi:integrase